MDLVEVWKQCQCGAQQQQQVRQEDAARGTADKCALCGALGLKVAIGVKPAWWVE